LPQDYLVDLREVESFLAQTSPEVQRGVLICILISQTDEGKESGGGEGRADKGIPMGSSRVENQMTCDGEVSVGRALRIERMALSP
jgi:hypothetical protein